MFALVRKTFGQLDDPTIRRVLAFAAVMAALVLAASWYGLSWLLDGRVATGIAWLDTALNWGVQVLGVAAVAVMAWLFYPGLVGAFAGIFLEEVADAVERRHFPDLPAPRVVSIWQATVAALRMAGTTIGLTLLALPLLLIPGLGVMAFLLLNGWLLGRGFFEIVALRRMNAADAARFRRSHRLKLLVPGLIIAGAMAVPLLNLVAPVLATVLMVHLFHRLPDRPRIGATGQ
jgi:uncharacterized protein involved in cysteine biosynthesis